MRNLTESYIRANPNKTFKEAFADIFEVTLEEGKFYKKHIKQCGGKMLFLFNGNYDSSNCPLGWGIDANGGFRNDITSGWGSQDLVEAPHSEAEEMLIKVAQKMGYDNGNHTCLLLPDYTHEVTDGKFYLDKETCRLHFGFVGKSNIVMMNGSWAEMVKTITKAQAEKLLGIKIV